MYDHFTDRHEVLYPDAPFPTLAEEIADIEKTIRDIEDEPEWYAVVSCMTLDHVANELDRLYRRLEALQEQMEGFQQLASAGVEIAA